MEKEMRIGFRVDGKEAEDLEFIAEFRGNKSKAIREAVSQYAERLRKVRTIDVNRIKEIGELCKQPN